MKKRIVAVFVLLCLLSLCACGKRSSTQLSVKLDPLDAGSVPRSDTLSVAPAGSSDHLRCSFSFSSAQTRAMSNFSNGGLFCADDHLYGRLCPAVGEYLRLGVIEFSNLEEGLRLGVPHFLDTDIIPSYLCRSGDFLYYVREANPAGSFSAARIGINGSGFQTLYIGTDCNYLQIRSGRLYFTNEEHCFVSTNMNGKDTQTIIDKEVYFPYFLDDEWLIYQDQSDNESLHLLNTDSKVDIKLNDFPGYSPVLAGNTLYFLGLPDGADRFHLCAVDIGSICLPLRADGLQYDLGREVAVGGHEVYSMFTDGEYLYGANNTVTPIGEWQSFCDNGYSFLSENLRFLSDGWSVVYQYDSIGDVRNVIIRTDTDLILPRVQE